MRQRWRKGEILTPRSVRGPGASFASAPTPCEMPPERGPQHTPTASRATEVGWPGRSDVRSIPAAGRARQRRRPRLAGPRRSGRGARGGAGRVLIRLRPLARIKFSAAARGPCQERPQGHFLVGGERYLASQVRVSAALASPHLADSMNFRGGSRPAVARQEIGPSQLPVPDWVWYRRPTSTQGNDGIEPVLGSRGLGALKSPKSRLCCIQCIQH